MKVVTIIVIIMIVVAIVVIFSLLVTKTLLGLLGASIVTILSYFVAHMLYVLLTNKEIEDNHINNLD